jgi:predicted ATPase
LKDSDHLYNPNFYIITGGPGVGKTNLLRELQARNLRCTSEIAREIIKEQVLVNGEALPWRNRELYLTRMFEGSIESYRKNGVQNDQVIFFDRGIPDSLTYAQLIGSNTSTHIEFYARNFRYNPKVFFLPPWRAIYETDEERKQDWEEAVMTSNLNYQVYQQLGYTLVEVPKDKVQARADFVLQIAGLG